MPEHRALYPNILDNAENAYYSTENFLISTRHSTTMAE